MQRRERPGPQVLHRLRRAARLRAAPLAALVLTLAGCGAGSDVGPLARDLKSEYRQKRLEAARKLAGLGDAGAKALGEAFPAADDELKAEILKSLSGMGPGAAGALGVAVGDKSLDNRVRAAEALAKLGPAAKPALPALVRMLRSVDDYPQLDQKHLEKMSGLNVLAEVMTIAVDLGRQQDAAGAALAAIGPDAMPAVEGLAGHPNPVVSMAALSQLGRFGAPALPRLRAAAKDKAPEVRAAAARGFGNAGPVAVPDLLVLYADPDFQVSNAARVQIVHGMDGAAPALVAALEGTDPALARSACEVLPWLIGRSDLVLPALEKASKSPDAALAKAASEGLEFIRSLGGGKPAESKPRPAFPK